MARSGNGSSARISRASALAAQTAFTVVLAHRSAVVPSGAANVCPLYLGDSGGVNFKLAFYWDQSGGASVPLWRFFDGAVDIDVAYLATPSADTWYRFGVRVSAAGYDIWLNGVQIASAAAPAIPNQTFELSIGSKVGATEWDDGTNAEVGIWNVALTDAEMAAVTGSHANAGLAPSLVRIGSLKFYADLIRDIFDWVSTVALSDTGSAVAQHLPMVYLAEPGHCGTGVSEFALDGNPASSFGVFGPRTRRNRIERKYFALARRWKTVALDSASRANSDRAGDTNSGHNWNTWSGDGIDQPWRLIDNALRAKNAVRGAAWTALPMGLTDVWIRVRVTYRTSYGEGLGIAFRLSEAGAGVLFHYEASGTWYLSEIEVPVEDAAPTITHRVTLGSSPALVVGTRYLLAVRVMGTTMGCFVDGEQIGSDEDWSLGRGETRHGIYTTGNFANSFDNVRILPQTRAW